jgi:hypothetical protein
MPNHCEGDLSIRGNADKVDALLARFTDTNEDGEPFIDLNRILPYPDEYASLDRKAREWMEEHHKPLAPFPDGFNSGGYEWCVENWGTKWGCYAWPYNNKPPLERQKTGVVLHFATAWSPFKFELLAAMSAEFPELTLTYRFYERGMAFKGKAVARAGQIISTDRSEYKGKRGG